MTEDYSTYRVRRHRRHYNGDHSECTLNCRETKQAWLDNGRKGNELAVIERIRELGFNPADVAPELLADLEGFQGQPDRLQRIRALGAADDVLRARGIMPPSDA